MKRARLTLVEPPSRHQVLREAVQSFLQRGLARNLAPRTLEFYTQRLGAFTHWLEQQGRNVAPEDVTPALVRQFLAAEQVRASAATARHDYSALRAFFRFLIREAWLTANPMERVEKVRVPHKTIHPFSAGQVDALLSQCGRGFNGARLRAILLTLLDCGLRVSELCALTLEDVSWDEGTLKVIGKGSKERVVPFGQAGRQALMAYLARRGELSGQNALFVTCYGDPMNRHEVYRVLRTAGRRAGVTGVRCSPHTFRHTFAVMYLRNGGDAFTLQRLLGHSDLAMTRRYCELSQVDALEKHRQCSPGDKFLTAMKPTRGRKRLR